MTYDEAIKAFKPIVDHEAYTDNFQDACKMAIEAIEKQIPKKPNERKTGFKSYDYVCPECACRIISKIDGEWIAGKKSRYCYNCGQAIDWSE